MQCVGEGSSVCSPPTHPHSRNARWKWWGRAQAWLWDSSIFHLFHCTLMGIIHFPPGNQRRQTNLFCQAAKCKEALLNSTHTFFSQLLLGEEEEGEGKEGGGRNGRKEERGASRPSWDLGAQMECGTVLQLWESSEMTKRGRDVHLGQCGLWAGVLGSRGPENDRCDISEQK